MKKTYFTPGTRQVLAALAFAVATMGAATAHTVTYTYYRFRATAVRSTSDPTIQLSEFDLFNSAVSGDPLQPTSAADSTNDNSGDGLPANAIDIGHYDTKWLNFDSTTGFLIVGFDSPQAVDSYNFYTGNDEAGRDPVSWVLEGSNDSNGPWTTLDVETNQVPNGTRSALAFNTDFVIPDSPAATITEFAYNDPLQSGIIANGSNLLVYVEADGDTLSISSSAGGSPVTVTSGNIATLTPPNNAFTTYTLTAHRAGGDATKTLTIRTVAAPTLTYRYIRYTPQKLGSGTTIGLDDLSFYHAGLRVPVAAVENPGGTSVDPTGVANLIDDPTTTTTEYQSVLSPVIFDFGTSPVSYDTFSFTTGADPAMAPKRWIMEGSNDKTSWTLVQNVNFDFNSPTTTATESPEIPFDGTSVTPFVSLKSPVAVATSGTPVLLSYSVLGATSGMLMPGSVPLTGTGTYSVSPTANTTYTLTATSTNGTATASLLLPVITGSATSLSFANFEDSTLIRTLGDAKVLNDFANYTAAGNVKRLRLTDEANGEHGSAWYLAKMPVKGGFDTSFDAQIATTFVPYGADGLSFVIQNTSTGLDTLNGDMVHLPANAVSVALDSFKDLDIEPGYANLEIWSDDTMAKVVDLSTTTPVISHGGQFLANYNNPDAPPYHVRIVYTPPATTGGNGAMTVYVDSNKVIDSFPISLEAAGAVDADGKAYVGFVARTGGYSEVHDITSWSLTTTPSTGGTTPLAITSSTFDTTGHTVTLNYSATTGQTYRVTTSTDLVTWTQVSGTTNTTATSASGTFTFGYTAAAKGFYRVELVTAP